MLQPNAEPARSLPCRGPDFVLFLFLGGGEFGGGWGGGGLFPSQIVYDTFLGVIRALYRWSMCFFR